MKADVHFRCGCILEVELPNDQKSRRSMQQQMQERSCRICAYQDNVQRAQQRAKALGLSDLLGTSRQVAYGSYLRGQQVDLFLRQLIVAQRTDPDHPRWERLRQHLFSTVNTQNEASWWIEHQALSALDQLLGACWKEEIDE